MNEKSQNTNQLSELSKICARMNEKGVGLDKGELLLNRSETAKSIMFYCKNLSCEQRTKFLDYLQRLVDKFGIKANS